MVVTPSETVIFFKKETEKECFPIVVTVSGMVISATLLSAKRAGGIYARSSEKYTLSVQGTVCPLYTEGTVLRAAQP